MDIKKIDEYIREMQNDKFGEWTGHAVKRGLQKVAYWVDNQNSKEIDKLKAENEKLRECVEDIARVNIFLGSSHEMRERARQALKELEG